jgi:TolA-binding protein
MNRNSPYENILDSWAREEISYDELRDYARSQGIEQFEEDAALHKSVFEGLKNEHLRLRIAKVHHEFAKPVPAEKAPAVLKSILQQKWIFRIAASLLIFTGLYIAQDALFVSGKKLSETMFTEYYMVNERNDNNPGTGELTNSFLNREYAKVTDLYEKNQAVPVREAFLAGYAYYKQNEFSKASEVFKNIMKKNANASIPLYRDEAEYYYALCALQTGNYSDAYKQFKNIRNNKTHTYHEKVSGLNLFRIRLNTF